MWSSSGSTVDIRRTGTRAGEDKVDWGLECDEPLFEFALCNLFDKQVVL